MTQRKRTSSLTAFKAFEHLFQKPEDNEEEDAIGEDTIPNMLALKKEKKPEDKELRQITESFQSLQSPDTTLILRTIQTSTESVIDQLLEEAEKVDVPENGTCTYLRTMQSGELEAIQVDDKELEESFKEEESHSERLDQIKKAKLRSKTVSRPVPKISKDKPSQ